MTRCITRFIPFRPSDKQAQVSCVLHVLHEGLTENVAIIWHRFATDTRKRRTKLFSTSTCSENNRLLTLECWGRRESHNLGDATNNVVKLVLGKDA